MDTREILEKIKNQTLTVEEGEQLLRRQPFEDLGYAKLDTTPVTVAKGGALNGTNGPSGAFLPTDVKTAGSDKLVKIGETLTIVVTAGDAVAQAANTTGATFTVDAATSTATVAELKTDGFAKDVAIAATDTVNVTLKISTPTNDLVIALEADNLP